VKGGVFYRITKTAGVVAAGLWVIDHGLWNIEKACTWVAMRVFSPASCWVLSYLWILESNELAWS
jgi:hypothetical protein